MNPVAQILIAIGGFMLIGLLTDVLGRRTALPRVTLLLLVGVIVGPTVLDVVPPLWARWYEGIASMALAMVGFLLGESLSPKKLRGHGRLVLSLSLTVVLVTFLVVFLGLMLAGVRADLALLLGAVATSTAPAATMDVVRQVRARGPFTNTLMGVVAVDDAWGLLLYSIVAAGVQAVAGDGGLHALLEGGWHVLGATLLGIALGIPMALLTGRIRPGEPTQAEALGFVLLCGGVAIWLDLSFILAAVVMGTTVARMARHHERPFHAIEGIEWPFMILFFVLSGASLQLTALAAAGWIGLGYIALRTTGRLIGARAGGAVADAPAVVRRWMGPALLPQAGVAIGLALVASQQFPELSGVLLPVVIGATVIFEAFSPLLTRLSLVRAGEVHAGRTPTSPQANTDAR